MDLDDLRMGRLVGAIPSMVGGVGITLSHTGRVFRLGPESLQRWFGWMRFIRRDQLLIWMVGSFLGMGDVLTGCVLAFLAQGRNGYDAARLAAYVHGRAADRIVARRGAAPTLAGEVSREIPEVLGELAIAPAMPPLPRSRRMQERDTI